MADLPQWIPPPLAAYGDILRAAAHVCDVADRERLARLALKPDAWAVEYMGELADLHLTREEADAAKAERDAKYGNADQRRVVPLYRTAGVPPTDQTQPPTQP